ncbi:hypothetical protein NOR_06324 [Metarhizium rileyi]|uniref:Tat pathway signal sequence n=1 Tax=Metarhizium rileyi (strain RCEF 4871) TaxID=1649241 RepID=A0A167AMB8_METRR|nr:hypothetical protein NOR_06324 [Metarhizium rileyi RCEF 4871]TWU71955.1 hypothetical protein ED733_000993 [Metarhizium rileyi]
MFTDSPIRYERIDVTDKYELADHERATDEEPGPSSTRQKEPVWTRRQATLVLLGNIVLLLISTCLLSAAVSRRPSPSHLECAQKVSPYSPMWEAVDFWEGNFANAFNSSTKYRGPPTLDLERAWNDLWYYHLIRVDSAGVAALNQTHVGRHAEVIGSDPANPEYGATLEVFHQLHCLNMLRQYSWPLDKFDKSWGDLYPSMLVDPVKARTHVDHCIETLRLTLMCAGDITPVLFVHDEDSPLGVRADFNIYHKCRSFDSIVDYVKENGVELAT